MKGIWENLGEARGLRVWFLRNDEVHNEVVLGVQMIGEPTFEIRAPRDLIRSLDQAYQYVIARL